VVPLVPLLTLPLVDPSTWIRVDDPDHPDAIARSATGAVLASPPTDGTPWRPESVPVLDVVLPGDEAWEGIVLPGLLGDPAAVTNADLWHARGITGRGVKVAVFDLGWFGGETDPAALGEVFTHDCYVTPTCEVPFGPLDAHTSVQGGVHGWGCAEAVRRVAPGVELHLVRTDSLTLLENAVDWAVRERVDVISLSMSFYNDSFSDGTGPHAALMAALDSVGALMVTSSGNDRSLYWAGPYVDADADGRLDGDADGGVWLYLEQPAQITLSWDQYGGRCGQTDLDLVVIAPNGDLVGASTVRQPPTGDGACRSVDSVTPSVPEDGWYRVEVHHRAGIRVGVDLRLVAKSGAFLNPMPGSVVDPGSQPLAVAVGAVRATQYAGGPLEPYSSWGRTEGRRFKPEIVGPDGLSVEAFGAAGFFGTSASTPVVAALVALVMEEDPSLSSAEAFARLQAWAEPPVPGPDIEPEGYGAGVARLPDLWRSRPGCGERPLLLALLGFGGVPWWWRRREALIERREGGCSRA
jgi:hypothetical protein